jgi:glucan endo-1,3-beta-D-glucosidase
MLFPIHTIFVLATSVVTASAQYKGFNYGSTNDDGSVRTQDQFESLFTTAQGLVGTTNFTSARLYTCIQAGTTNTPIEAIPAAIASQTTLLLGLWASAGQDDIDNEIAALTAAFSQYGTSFTDLIVGISVGSEDLYRVSPTGIDNLSGAGAEPADIVTYIGQVRSALSDAAVTTPVGHVDTWTAWVNGSNAAVITASDFLGVDAYPYYQVSTLTLFNELANILIW